MIRLKDKKCISYSHSKVREFHFTLVIETAKWAVTFEGIKTVVGGSGPYFLLDSPHRQSIENISEMAETTPRDLDEKIREEWEIFEYE